MGEEVGEGGGALISKEERRPEPDAPDLFEHVISAVL